MMQDPSTQDQLQRELDELRQRHQALQKRMQTLQAKLKRQDANLSREKTARRLIEKRFRIFQNAVETMHLGITITNLSRKIVYVNPADAEMHGYRPGELIGQNVGIFVPPELRHNVTIEEVEQLRGWVRESLNVRKDGSRFPVHLMSDLVKNDEGEPIAIITTCEDITKRWDMNNALRHSEWEKSLILDSMSELLLYYDKDLNILWMNRAASLTLQKSTVELIGQPFQDVWWHKDVPEIQELWKKVLETLSPQEGRFPSPGGGTWSIRVYPIFDEYQQFLGLVEFARNVSIQQQALARVEHLNAVLEAIRGISQLIIREKSPKRLIQSACDNLVGARGYAGSWVILLNKAGEIVLSAGSTAQDGEISQYVSESLMQEGLFSCLGRIVQHPERSLFEYCEGMCKQCCFGQSHKQNEKAAIKICYNDTLYGILFVAIPDHLAADREEYALLEEISCDMAFALYNIDLERRRDYAERIVRSNEQWLAATLNNLSEAVVTTNARGLVSFFNPAAERLTGWKVDEVMGEDISFKVVNTDAWEEEPRKTLRSNGEVRAQITIVPGEYTILIARDGTYIPIEYSGNAIVNDEEQFVGFVMVFKDITERRQMELALEAERASLAEKVQERTAELSSMNERLQDEIVERQQTQLELQKAKEIAESASWAKSEFLANMSHELRTPLNAILGYAQIIKNASNLSERQMDGMEIINNSGNHLLNLINEILDLSKIEAGQMDLNPTKVDFFKFLAHITEMIEIRAKQRGVDFIFKRDPILPAGVLVDEKRLRQVLLNLLGNAVKFTEKGSVSFRVDVLRNRQHSNPRVQTVRFEVADTGIGIAQDQRSAIFQPFRQVGEKRHSVEGTGLGLTISQKLIRLMKSTLVMRSKLGKGTVFHFDLMLENSSDFMPQTEPERRTVSGYTGERKTILVVDDRQENRKLLYDMLAPLGFEVLEAVNGREGMEQIVKYQPDITLLDLRMPVMDGIDTVQELRKDPTFRDNIIIAVSASVYENDRRQSLQLGCNDFLRKPLCVDELLDLFQKYLHLTWIYSDDIDAEHARISIPESTDSGDLELYLAAEDREILLRYALSGRVKPFLSHLETLNARLQPELKELRQLAKRFELKEIVKRLEEESPQS
ncbi:hypothetical protein CSB45_03735 [candidate division KSB3 bacterium]|uniref:histidine kinase n=1 Tax=candidate division KSB3 bacterium TaxID=2044937 RepID=A0A2G6E9C3_9BACT|nr:MAG: hypothetical protein CSB45_03735 [candidate division KSB3 bacterium]